MSKYDIDLDYAIPKIDISVEELNEIIVEADSIIAQNSASPEKLTVAYLKKAQCLHKLAQISDSYEKEKLYKAKGLLEKVLKLTPNMPEALMRLGSIYSDISEYERSYLDGLRMMNPNDEIVVSISVKKELGPPISREEFEKLPLFDYLFNEAVTMLTKAIQLKPDYAAAYNNRSIIYSSEKYSRFKNENHQNNIKKAMADLTEAIRIRPNDATYYLNRGQIYSEVGEHEKAFYDFTCVIKYGSDEFKNQTNAFSFLKIHFSVYQKILSQRTCVLRQ
jgi:tetratricopeptide (TPR) repeat protein